MDEKLMNEELDDLLSRRLKTISSTKGNKLKKDHLMSMQMSMDTKNSDYRTTSRPASRLQNKSQLSSVIARQNSELPKDSDERSQEPEYEEMTSLAKSLLANSVKNKLMTMIQEKVEEFK